MERIPNKERKKFRLERDMWLDRMTTANAELSRISIERNNVTEKFKEKNEELSNAITELDKARFETENKRTEKELYELMGPTAQSKA